MARSTAKFRHVYFMEAEGLGAVKIGVADSAPKRLGDLQVGLPVPLTLRGVWHADDAVKLEGHFHKHFAAYHIRGEWFRLDGALEEFVDENLFAPEESHIQFCFLPRPYNPDACYAVMTEFDSVEGITNRLMADLEAKAAA